MPHLRAAFRWTWHVVCLVLLALSAFVLIAGVFLPRLAGATPYTITTGSMKPSYPPGTLVIAKPVALENLKPGDAITYQLESGRPQVVTHRIVGTATTLQGDPLFQTQGDANDTPDRNLVYPVQIKGKVWYHVPFMGHSSALMSGEHRTWITYGIGGLLALYSLTMFWGAIVSRRPRPPKAPRPPAPTGPGAGSAPRVPVLARTGAAVAAVVALIATVGLPSGAFWTDTFSMAGTTVTAGTVTAPPGSPYCRIVNTTTGQVEPNTSCTVTLAALGCTSSWSTGANAYLNFTPRGVVTSAANGFGQNLVYRFQVDLRALGCNPPGLDWASSPGPGIQVGSGITLVQPYSCSRLPVVEASVPYYSAGPSTFLGQILFKRTTGAISCSTSN